MRQVSKISLDGSLLKKGPANQGWRSASWISPWLIFFQIYNILPPSFVIYCILQYTVYYPLVICYIANEKTKNIVDLPIEDGDVPVRYVSLPESTSISKWKKKHLNISQPPKKLPASPLSFCGIVLVKKAERLRVAWRKKRCVVAGSMWSNWWNNWWTSWIRGFSETLPFHMDPCVKTNSTPSVHIKIAGIYGCE